MAAEAWAAQDRFSAEPVFDRTGNGYLKSVWVTSEDEVVAFRKFCEAPGDA